MSEENKNERNEGLQSVRPNTPVPARPAIYVRVTPEEYLKIASEAKAIGETIPDHVKRVYFTRKGTAILMHKKDLETVLGQLGRIGNNINQIAKALNGSIREASKEEIAGMRKSFDMLISFMTLKFKPVTAII